MFWIRNQIIMSKCVNDSPWERVRKTLIYTIERSKVRIMLICLTHLQHSLHELALHMFILFCKWSICAWVDRFCTLNKFKNQIKMNMKYVMLKKTVHELKYTFLSWAWRMFQNINEVKGSFFFFRFVQIKLLFMPPPIDTFF